METLKENHQEHGKKSQCYTALPGVTIHCFSSRQRCLPLTHSTFPPSKSILKWTIQKPHNSTDHPAPGAQELARQRREMKFSFGSGLRGAGRAENWEEIQGTAVREVWDTTLGYDPAAQPHGGGGSRAINQDYTGI